MTPPPVPAPAKRGGPQTEQYGTMGASLGGGVMKANRGVPAPAPAQRGGPQTEQYGTMGGGLGSDDSAAKRAAAAAAMGEKIRQKHEAMLKAKGLPEGGGEYGARLSDSPAPAPVPALALAGGGGPKTEQYGSMGASLLR